MMQTIEPIAHVFDTFTSNFFNFQFIKDNAQHLIVGDHESTTDYYQDQYDPTQDVFAWVLIIASYLFLSIAGFFLFPPMMICLALSGGDLSTCSFEIWWENT